MSSVLGAVAGPLIGAVGSLIGGHSASSAAGQAAQQSMTGYNYLTGKNGTQGYVDSGNNANNMQAQLLGAAPLGAGTSNAFNNYLNSAGYKFQLGQGIDAINGSQAARGILNSGSTAKALESFGQGLAGQTFNNYLDQLGNVSQSGLTAAGQIGAAGTGGGASAAQATQNGGVNMGNAFTTAGGVLGGALSNVGGLGGQGNSTYSGAPLGGVSVPASPINYLNM